MNLVKRHLTITDDRRAVCGTTKPASRTTDPASATCRKCKAHATKEAERLARLGPIGGAPAAAPAATLAAAETASRKYAAGRTRQTEITPADEGFAAARADNAAARADVTTVAAEWLQTLPAPVLAAAARGDIDLNAIARAELANRGLDWAGKWVGFDKAAAVARMLPATGRNGERIAVSIPDSDSDDDSASWIVRCRVSGGVTGTRESIVKGSDGQPKRFDSDRAAAAYARQLTSDAGCNGATRFQYWPARAEGFR